MKIISVYIAYISWLQDAAAFMQIFVQNKFAPKGAAVPSKKISIDSNDPFQSLFKP